MAQFNPLMKHKFILHIKYPYAHTQNKKKIQKIDWNELDINPKSILTNTD